MLEIKPYYSGSSGNLYLLYNNETKILLECGVQPKTIRKCLSDSGLMIADLDGCVITHYHGDHALSVDYVSDYVDTYGTKQLKDKYKKVIEIKPNRIFKISTIQFYPIKVEHGNAENNAFIIMDKESCIFFGTDFSLMLDKIENPFDKVYIECNYQENELNISLQNIDDTMHEKYLRQISTHLSLENCIEHLKHFNLSKCKEIVLIHCSSNKYLLNKQYAEKRIESIFNIKTKCLTKENI